MRAAVWASILAIAGGSAASAQDVGDPDAGHSFAQSLCAKCHAVEAGDSVSPNSAAPTFDRIANFPGMTATALFVVLSNPHRQMPDFIIERDRMRDVVAYLLTLKRHN